MEVWDIMTFGEKLRSARKDAGLTQEQLAERLALSRQAITKWESDKGMPDIENLKRLSEQLAVSIDFLLDDGREMDLSVMREAIDLDAYEYDRKRSGRLIKKAGKKDRIVREKYPHGKIHALLGTQILTKGEKMADNLIGFLTSAPFGLPQFINSVKNVDKEFYLIDEAGKQFLVMVTDEFMESRQLAERITAKKFEIGNFSFMDLGPIPEPKEKQLSDEPENSGL